MVSAIARRYGKALYDLASEERSQESVRDGLQDLSGTFARNPDLADACLNPMLRQEERGRVLEEVMGQINCGPTVKRFVELLVFKNRLAHLQDIAVYYSELVEKALGRESVQVRTPRVMSESAQTELKARLEKSFGHKIVLSVQQDPSLISGITVQIGSQVFDGSVRGRLGELRKVLLRQKLGQ